MARYSTKAPAYVHGFSTISFNITTETSYYNASSWWGNRRLGVPGQQSINLSLSLAAHPAGVDSIPEFVGKSLIGLGTGKTCPYCSTYWPTGNYLCWNCGGQLGDLPLVRPVDFGGVVTSVNMTFPIGGIMTMDMQINDLNAAAWGEFHLDTFQLRPWSFMNTNLSTHYLCPWCGLAVEQGKDCYGCGGPRTPLQELVDIERECSWCGNKTVNGIMCQQCGARVSGTTIREVLG